MSAWQTLAVGDLIDGLSAGVSVRARDGDASRPAVLKTSAVAGGRVDLREVKAIIPMDVTRARCEIVGDSMIVSRMNTPSLVGAVGHVEDDARGVFLPDRLWLARTSRNNKTNMRWLSYALGFGDAATGVRELATGTSNSMKNIPKSRLLALRLAVPPLREQEAIAGTLRTADGLIASLERLIAKKRDIKQGIMQELLTGRNRLPGFTDEWELRKLGSIALMGSGGTPASSVARYYGGEIPWVSISDMTKGGKYIRATETTLTEEGLGASAAKLYDADVVLYAMYASLGECSLAVGRVSSSQAILGISVGQQLDREYVYYALQALKPQVKLMGQQGTQANLNAGMVRDFDIHLPKKPEQVAIAGVLRDADAEIDALTRRLASAHAIKQGMMQELLTGRARLVAEGIAA